LFFNCYDTWHGKIYFTGNVELNPEVMKTFARLIFLFALIFLMQLSCKKNGEVPVLSTSEVVGITSFTAISGGDITSDGGSGITERGVCWSESPIPTISDNKRLGGKGTGSFTTNLNHLTGNTAYYVAAYATNSAGTGYGDIKTFTTPATVTDINGNVYSTVDIGTQTWMAENLKTTSYRNGDPITYATPGGDWSNPSGVYYDYDLIGNITAVYGNFYNWYAVSDNRNLAPEGWHVATWDDWTTLVDYLGGIDNAGAKMKEAGYIHWLFECGGNATNISGFTALPAGMAGDDHRGWEARFWSSTDDSEIHARYLFIDCSDMILMTHVEKVHGNSVRCVKD
jgi:uncharacterized protein (TIGR02145 family)